MMNVWLYATDEECQTPLSRAAKSNHMALTELLLRQEVEDRMASLEGSSLLHKAASLGLEEAVKRLLSEWADPNELDKYGETPLHKAARHGHRETARLLLERNANVNAVNVFGLTPLHWVALNGRADLAEMLIVHGADANLANEYLDGLTPMSLARIMGYEDMACAMEGHMHMT
jgi:ankyrin repeat protein